MHFEIYDRVKIVNSSDSRLDGRIGTLMGTYGENSSIVVFDIPPPDYNPAIVVVNQIIERL